MSSPNPPLKDSPLPEFSTLSSPLSLSSLRQLQQTSVSFYSPLRSLCFLWEHFLQPAFFISPLIMKCQISLLHPLRMFYLTHFQPLNYFLRAMKSIVNRNHSNLCPRPHWRNLPINYSILNCPPTFLSHFLYPPKRYSV